MTSQAVSQECGRRLGDGGAPRVTVAVIHHHLRGYPRECLESMGAGAQAGGVEYLLVGGGDAPGQAARFPAVRRVRVAQGDRATAKNLALAEARGEFVYLTTADTLAGPGAVAALRRFLESRRTAAVVSAQVLYENGMRRWMDFGFPSVWRECNLAPWTWRWVRRTFGGRWEPFAGAARPARSLHATSLMARRDVFERVGAFSEGYRFGAEDIEWCWRAAAKGIERFILPEARVFKIAPQECGRLSPEVRLAMAHSFERLVERTRGRAHGALYTGVRRAGFFCRWVGAAAVRGLLFGGSQSARDAEAVYRVLSGVGGRRADIPEDVESRVRWERAF